MRATLTLASLTTLLLLVAPPAFAADKEPSGRAQLDVYSHLGVIGGGKFDPGPTIGIGAHLAWRANPEFSIRAGAVGSADLLVNGYTSASWSLGGVFSPFKLLRLGAGLRSRSLTDGQGLAETLGEVVALVVLSPLCATAGDPGCAEIDAVTTHVEDLGVELTLSSQWQWSWFVLGLEWFSFYQPVVLRDAWRNGYDVNGDVLYRAKAVDLTVADLPREWRIVTMTVGAAF